MIWTIFPFILILRLDFNKKKENKIQKVNWNIQTN